MKKEQIILNWKESGKEYEKTLERQSMFELMQAIKNGFDGDNEISSIMVEIIPKLVSMRIDKDRNEQLEVPIVVCELEQEKERIIYIRRYHKIIWSILNKYCTE